MLGPPPPPGGALAPGGRRAVPNTPCPPRRRPRRAGPAVPVQPSRESPLRTPPRDRLALPGQPRVRAPGPAGPPVLLAGEGDREIGPVPAEPRRAPADAGHQGPALPRPQLGQRAGVRPHRLLGDLPGDAHGPRRNPAGGTRAVPGRHLDVAAAGRLVHAASAPALRPPSWTPEARSRSSSSAR